MNIMCDRWKLTNIERFKKWCDSITNLPKEYKTLLRETGDDTERYQNQLDQEETLIDPISIPLYLNGKKVSTEVLVDIKLSQSQLDIWTIGRLVQAIKPYIGKRCLIREHYGSYEDGSICLDFHGRSLRELSYGLLLSSLVRDGELPYFNVYHY